MADAYNHPRNAPLLGHTEAMADANVVDHYAEMAAAGARQFLLFVDDALAGDAACAAWPTAPPSSRS